MKKILFLLCFISSPAFAGVCEDVVSGLDIKGNIVYDGKNSDAIRQAVNNECPMVEDENGNLIIYLRDGAQIEVKKNVPVKTNRDRTIKDSVVLER